MPPTAVDNVNNGGYIILLYQFWWCFSTAVSWWQESCFSRSLRCWQCEQRCDYCAVVVTIGQHQLGKPTFHAWVVCRDIGADNPEQEPIRVRESG